MELVSETSNYVRRLVGDISKEDLRYVDYYVSKDLGIFIPSVGFCDYAIKRQHTHPAYSFILSFSPEQSIIPVKIKTKSNHYLTAAMAPYIKHEEEETSIFTRYIAIFISEEFYEKYYKLYSCEKPEKYFWNQFLVREDIMIYIKKFMSEYECKQIGYESILESISVIITNHLIRNILKIDDLKDLFIEKFDTEKAIEYMHQNFGEKLTVARLANLVNMSESHFTRVFKKETQLSPIEYLIKLRIDKAKKLLRANNKSVTEIALQCGFNSTSHFSSCFIKQIGSTPTEYQSLYSR